MTLLKTLSFHVIETKVCLTSIYAQTRSYSRYHYALISSTDQPMKRLGPTAGHRSTSGRKRKIENRKTFENGPEVDSGVEEQQKSKRTRVRTDPAQADAARHIGKTYNLLKRK